MGKTAYEKCQELILEIKKEFETEISFIELSKIISKNIGADKRTIENYVRYLQIFNMLKAKGNAIFRIK